MAALVRELVEQFQKLTEDQQRKVLEFARSLEDQSAEADWEQQPWTEDEIREMMKPTPKTGAELVAWLDKNPAPEPWGNLSSDEDPATYVHNQRREHRMILEESDESDE